MNESFRNLYIINFRLQKKKKKIKKGDQTVRRPN